MNISSDITVNEGSSVTLLCLAIGRPEPTVTWRHLSVKGKACACGESLELVYCRRDSAVHRNLGNQKTGLLYTRGMSKPRPSASVTEHSFPKGRATEKLYQIMISVPFMTLAGFCVPNYDEERRLKSNSQQRN